jgi:hypothetical protein
MCDCEQNTISFKFGDSRDCTWLNAYEAWLADGLDNNMEDEELADKYGEDTHDFFESVCNDLWQLTTQ